MKASPIQLCKFLQKQDTQFVIPIYQRNYDWSEDNCRQLLDDICEVGSTSREDSKVHFIGSIVYVCNDEYTTDEIEQFVVIDGQQRITTITLLLIAIYHYAQYVGDTRLAETIYEYYLINKNADDDNYKIKLKATENNDKDLQALLEGRPISEDHYSNIKNNYNFFKQQLRSDNINTIYDGFGRLLFVEIRLERGKDNAQRIFESLNSTGLDLSQADLIRNYILMGLEPSEQKRLYNNYWSEIEANTKTNGASYVSDFIRDFITIKKGEIPNKNTVYANFKKQYPLDKIDSIEPILAELLKFSNIYKKLIAPDTESDCIIKKELAYINYIEINVTYPFLLQLIDDYNNSVIDKPTLIEILQFVQTYVCRRFILDLPTNALNKVFMNLHRQIDINNYKNSLYYYVLSRSGKVRMPSDSEIRNVLADKDMYNAKSRMKLYILERLEHFENREVVKIINNQDITIEHIFPQKPETRWATDITVKDYVKFKEKYLHTIGNLTLSGNNGSLGNKVFIDKKLMNKDGGEQGYIYSSLWLNRFLKTIDKWTVDNYQNRTELLINRFMRVWYLPIVEGIKDVPEQNICEIDNPTYKQIEYSIFFGDKLPGDKYKGIKLYIHIVRELFRLQGNEFIEKFRDLLKITEIPERLHRSHQLNSTYYFDTNLGLASQFANLQKILRELDLTDELYVKFRN